jgi:hypothetical protein
MMQYLPLTVEQSKHLDGLRQVPRGEMPKVFRNLEAPTLNEMNGEYDAVLLHQGHWIANRVVPMLFNLNGIWLRKGYVPLNASEGRGYNVFRRGGRICHRFTMQTFVGKSRLVRGESFFLNYRPFNDGLIGRLVGELRRFAPGLYVGIGVLGPVFMGRFYYRRFPFALIGPRYLSDRESTARGACEKYELLRRAG